MSFFFPGQSKCQICGLVIENSEEAVSFPPFLGKSHKLHQYSDGNFHRRCLEASPDKEELDRLFSRFREIWDARPRDLETMEEIEAWGKSAFKEFS